jgi:protein-tyrosine phosphatase
MNLARSLNVAAGHRRDDLAGEPGWCRQTAGTVTVILITPMKSSLADAFGSSRGFLRHLKYHATWRMRDDIVGPSELTAAGRLAFVCQGNICRSALAQAVAATQGFESCSYGLDTVDGKPADPRVIRVAEDLGYDLSRHVTTPIHRYEPREGDLLLLMQPDHVAALHAALPERENLPQVTLLGLWATPRRPYIHDPYMAGDGYQRRCAEVIERAVTRLCHQLESVSHVR